MKKNDIDKTIHLSKNEQLISNLIKDIPKNVKLIEPFCGEKDLLKFFPNHSWEYYDIKETGEHYKDTLISPPKYQGKWVITNPPYLAKNKADDKTLFELYSYDDLYKIAISTLLEAEGGILILPINFFSDERTGKLRTQFFENFSINNINIFIDGMFDNTNYNVCSFSFYRNAAQEVERIPIILFPNKTQGELSLLKNSNYRIGGDFFNKIKNVKNVFGRLIEKETKDFITNIQVNCLDKMEERLGLQYNTQHFYGKVSDRIFATLTCKEKLSINEQKEVIEMANQMISDFRNENYDLGLTNYRDRGRKRISFTECYKICSYCLEKIRKTRAEPPLGL